MPPKKSGSTTAASKSASPKKAAAPKAATKEAAPKKAAAKKAEPHRPAPSREEIAHLAQHFWVERGRPIGSPEVDWNRAEHELMSKHR